MNPAPSKHIVVGTLLGAAMLPFTLKAAPGVGTRYLHADHLGSTVAVSDTAPDAVTNVRYRPWGGACQAGDGGSAARFTGKVRDAGTGLYYFGARYLNARSGRFASADPARQITSPYAYVAAAPLANIDPDGRKLTGAEEILLEALLDRKEMHMATGGRRVPGLGDIIEARASRLQYRAQARDRGVASGAVPGNRYHADAIRGLRRDMRKLRKKYYGYLRDYEREAARHEADIRQLDPLVRELHRQSDLAFASVLIGDQLDEFLPEPMAPTMRVKGLGASGDLRETVELTRDEALAQIDARLDQLTPLLAESYGLRDAARARAHRLAKRRKRLRRTMRHLDQQADLLPRPAMPANYAPR